MKKNSEIFYKSLQECINKTQKNDYSLVVGDLNARVGKLTIPRIVGPNGENTLNVNGRLRDFCSFNDMRITNTFFPHKDIHKYTRVERGQKTIIRNSKRENMAICFGHKVFSRGRGRY